VLDEIHRLPEFFPIFTGFSPGFCMCLAWGPKGGAANPTDNVNVFHSSYLKFVTPIIESRAHLHESHRTLRDGSLGSRYPRHFVPGYYRPVPPGQKPFAHRRPA
jgi:hypothetical protein